MRLIPIEDVTVSLSLVSSSFEEGELYHEALVDNAGRITNMSDRDLDLVGRKRGLD